MSQPVKASFGQSEEVFYRSQITIYLNIKIENRIFGDTFHVGHILSFRYNWLAGNQMGAIEYINAFSGSFFVFLCVQFVIVVFPDQTRLLFLLCSK